MPNRQNPSGSQSQDNRPGKSQERGKSQQQWQGTRENEDERSDSDRVEIGDPVPENQRTVRANTRGEGETGEDEDLPSDDGNIEGSRSERH